jgi:hypothetical protein
MTKFSIQKNFLNASDFHWLRNFYVDLSTNVGIVPITRIGCTKTFWFPINDVPKNQFESILKSKFAPLAPEETLGFEWWLLFQRTDQHFQLHFDRDEVAALAQGIHYSPLQASVFYINNVGLPTVVYDIKPADEDMDYLLAASIQDPIVITPPEDNKLLLFQGDLLHGIKGQGMQSDEIRFTFLVNFWKNKPLEPHCYRPQATIAEELKAMYFLDQNSDLRQQYKGK